MAELVFIRPTPEEHHELGLLVPGQKYEVPDDRVDALVEGGLFRRPGKAAGVRRGTATSAEPAESKE